MDLYIELSGIPHFHEQVTIPPGRYPWEMWADCTECYMPGANMTVYVTLHTPDRMYLARGTVAITHLSVTDAVSASDPARVVASFSGLIAGEGYTLALWCKNPKMIEMINMWAVSTEDSIDYLSLPGICQSTRYLTISSKEDGVHMAVAKDEGA